MDPTFGPATDPTPFFALAFGFGTLFMVGFFVWTLLERRKLRQLLVAVQRP